MKKRTRTSIVVATVMLLSLAGCTDVTDDMGLTETDDLVSAQGEPIDASPATRALAEAGFSDPYLAVEPTGVVHEFEFWVDEAVALNPYGDKDLFALGFTEDPNEPGQVPGPEIRVTQGDTVRITMHSPESDFPGHTMHWHGVDVPWSADGVPFGTQKIADPQEPHTFTYEFVAKQPGTYWYHCVTAFPVDADAGLFGALIVEPQESGADLPYDREETLFFHEMDSQWLMAFGWTPLNPDMDPDPNDAPNNPMDLIGSAQHQTRNTLDTASWVAGGVTGEYLFNEGPRDYYPTWSPRYKPQYDTFMINGKSYPDTDPVDIKEGEIVRLRMINAGQLHKSIHLHGHHVLVTHVDGYPLDRPHWEDTLNLAPGERKDVYVQGTNPGIWSLHDHSGAHGMGSTSTNDYAFPGGMKTVLAYEDFQPPGEWAQPSGDVTAGDLAVYAPSYHQR